MMKRIFYTKHAMRRMSERGIPRGIVEAVVLNPDYRISESDIKKAVKVIEGTAYTIVLQEAEGYIRIITVY